MSALGPEHRYSARVRTLLEAARSVIQQAGWTASSALLRLDLLVSGPTRPPGDAANYLGGVVDVLQDKTLPGRNVNVTHLGDLATVALYRDDKQIKELHYREEVSLEPQYEVRLIVLD